MRIWYQGYAPVHVGNSAWSYYDDTIGRQLAKVARPDTVIDVHGAKAYATAFYRYRYFHLLHKPQIIEAALQAEREGYDAVVTSGMMDPGLQEMREVVNIPVIGMAETAFHLACLLAPRFSLICPSQVMLQIETELIKSYGLEERSVPGVHLGMTERGGSSVKLVQILRDEPQSAIDMFTEAAKRVIEQGAGILVAGIAVLSLFLADKEIRSVDGVPVMNNLAGLIKMAEMMVDLRKMGVSRSRNGLPSKEELVAARKIYGVT